MRKLGIRRNSVGRTQCPRESGPGWDMLTRLFDLVGKSTLHLFTVCT
jgi:hypothetical protein